MSTTDTTLDQLVQEQHDSVGASGTLAAAHEAAAHAAEVLRREHCVVVVVEPGNGTRYDVLLTRLDRPALRFTRDGGRAPDRPSETRGGNLAVSLVGARGGEGRCFAVSLTFPQVVHAGWLAGAADLNLGDAVHVASLLSYLSAELS